ncbi:MAG: branched-chain amino acid ABC transporter permease [Haloarculaceae archaeon]
MSDPDAGGGDLGRLDRFLALKERELYVVLFTTIGVLLFPMFLIDFMGTFEGFTGLSLGGYVGLPTLVLVYGIVVIGFNVLLGYTGLLSFGHAAFFGVAAYAAAIFSTVVSGGPLAMILVGFLAGTLLAWPIGFLSIRRSGVYFAVLTLTFGQMLYYLAMGPAGILTHGDDGFTPNPQDLLGTFALDRPLQLFQVPVLGWEPHLTPRYLLAGAFTVLAVAVAHRIIKSPYGLIFEALGQNEQRVSFVGLDVFRYKLMAFVISGAFAGVGGALYTLYKTSLIHPNGTLLWVVSGDFVIMTAIGGVGTLIGPIFGAAIFEYIRLVLSGITVFGVEIGSAWRFLLGLAFVLVVAFFPKGVYGGLRGLAHRIAVLLGASEARPESAETPAGSEPRGDD